MNGASRQCQHCNLFMSYEDMRVGVKYSPYGDAYHIEPPDDEFVHTACWDRMGIEKRERIRRISYRVPSRLGVPA